VFSKLTEILSRPDRSILSAQRQHLPSGSNPR
jgi:hypothetical protein